jgi:hypothetical protein
MPTSNIEYLKAGRLKEEVNTYSGFVVIECYKYSKGPLFIMEPIFRRLHESSNIKIKQFRTDLLENPEVEEEYHLVVVPCYLVFNNHKLVDKIYGVTQFHEYLINLEEQSKNILMYE